MTRIKMKLSLFLLLCTVSLTYAQNFEGWITYKMEALNPNPEMIPESSWQEGIKEQFGERGYMVHKYFYKHNRYLSEIDAGKEKGFQLYNPNDQLLYSWQMNAEDAVTIDSRENMDEFIEIVDGEAGDTILGIPCKSIIVKSDMGQMTLWYNSDYFKMDADLYRAHILGHWEQILDRIGCLPLKMEHKGFMTHLVQTAIEYKIEAVSDDKFTLPKFKTINDAAVD